MKKFTLLIAMLLCAVGFGQNLSDVSASEYAKVANANQKVVKLTKTTQIASTAVAQESVAISRRAELPEPSAEIQAILDKLAAAGTVASSDDTDILTVSEKNALVAYYEQGNNTNSFAPGDVYAYNLRASCGNDFGSFPLTGPYDIVPIITDPGVSLFAGDLNDDGDAFGLDVDFGVSTDLVSIDLTTGTPTVVSTLSGLLAGHNPSGFAWDSSSGTWYVLSTDGPTTNLYSLDPGTGVLTDIGDSGFDLGIWLAIDQNGNAFSASIGTDSLFSIDLTTGAATLVGPLGIDISFAQDADFDPDTNTLYMGAYIGGGVNFFASVDTTTGTATTLGTINSDCCEAGMIAIEGTPSTGPSCSESNPSNTFENGFTSSSDTPQVIGADITVPADNDLSLTQLITNFIIFDGDGIDTADIMVYGDAAGLPDPGNVIGSALALAPTAQPIIGDFPANPGLDILELTFDLPTAIDLAGTNGSTTTYWISVYVTTTLGNSSFWEFSTASVVGNDGVFSADNGATWGIALGGADQVYTWNGNCTPIIVPPPTGCLTGIYDDRTAFDAELATGTAFLEDFAGGPGAIAACDGPINDAGNSCFAAGEILAGVEVTTSTPANPDPIVFVPAGAFSNTSDVVGANQFASFTIINFPNNDVNAFGFDLSVLLNGSNVDVRIFGTGGLIETVTVDGTSTGPVFFGYIADETVVSVEIEDLGAGEAELIGQLAFGNCNPIDEDVCEGAAEIACDDVVVGDTSDNTDTGGANDSNDEWYAFEGTIPGQMVTASLCDGGTAFDSVLTVYSSCGGAVVVSNDDTCGLQSEVTWLSDGATTYYIAVEGFDNTESGPFSLAITCVDPPANDLCDNAEPIGCGDVLSGTTINATDDTAAAPDCDTTTSAPGVWYIYEDTSGLITDLLVSTCSGNTDYDTKISVYTGDCSSLPLTCVAGNDDSANCTDFQSEVEWQSDGNTTYYILVHGFNGAQGNFDISLTCTIVPPPNDDIADAIDLNQFDCPWTDEDVAMPGATTEAGTPADCDINGANGVWYTFTPIADGFIRGTVASPAGITSVTFYSAPDETSTEDELVLVDWFENQCFPNTTARIPIVAGQSYYCFVVNSGGITDIVFEECDDTLGTSDVIIEGFSYYPNPAIDVVNLSAAQTIEKVEVYNMLGQKVLDQKVNAVSSQINVAQLTQGTYLMQVSVDGKVGVYHIIKE